MNSSLHELIRLRAKVVALTILAFHLPVIAYSQTKQAQPGFHEQRWVSDDGTVSLALPNPKTFVAEPAPKAPFVASWISNDKKIKLGVVHTNLPSHIEFEQATAEERFAKGSKGKVTGLPSTKVGGQEVWRMKSKYAGGEKL